MYGIISVAILAQAPFCSVLCLALVRFGYGGAHRLLWCLVFWLTRMTHSRSIAARARRTDRALTLGYVRNRPLDRVHIAVPAALASSVKVVAKSIQLHAAHDSIAGRPHHHARIATLSISDQIGDMSFAVPSALIELLDVQNIMWELLLLAQPEGGRLSGQI